MTLDWVLVAGFALHLLLYGLRRTWGSARHAPVPTAPPPQLLPLAAPAA